MPLKASASMRHVIVQSKSQHRDQNQQGGARVEEESKYLLNWKAFISLFCRLAETVSIFTAVSISKTYNDETCTSQCVLGELQMSGKHTWERMLI